MAEERGTKLEEWDLNDEQGKNLWGKHFGVNPSVVLYTTNHKNLFRH